MLNFNCGIYAITSPSGRQYIGSAASFTKRWKEHLRQLRNGNHHCKALQRAFMKYGENALTFSRVAICPPDDLIYREQEQLDSRRVTELYNTSKTAGSTLGTKHSAEARANISKGRQGRGKLPKTPEHRAKIAAAKLGVPRSPETISKMSSAMLGRPLPLETVEKMAKTMRGRAQRNNTSGFPCVYKKRKAWQARVSVRGTSKSLGVFATPELANAAVLSFLRSLEKEK